MFSTLRHLFTPHHTNNHRPRILHPMGMVVMVALILVTSSGVNLLEAQPPQGFVLGYASNIQQYQVFEQVNQERINSGLAPLGMSEKLNQAAAAKAADMFANDYWAHISPSGVPPWTFIKNTGYRYSVAGENLARDFDTTAPMVSAWMASPTHKANIVHTKYTETGIAVVNGVLGGIETTLVVQMFGLPAQPVIATAPQKTSPQSQLQEAPSIGTQAAGDELPTVSQSEEVAPLEQQVRQVPTVLSQTQTNSNQPSVFISPLDVKKSVVLAVILLIMTVLVVDEMIIRHRNTMRFVGRNFAHLSFLVFALVIIWSVVQPGTIQ